MAGPSKSNQPNKFVSPDKKFNQRQMPAPGPYTEKKMSTKTAYLAPISSNPRI